MTQDAALDRLSAVPLFSPMDRKALVALVAASETRLFAKGMELDVQSEDHLMILLAGSVALSVREADRTAIFSTSRTPGALNLACVMARAGCQIRWRALEDATVLVVPTRAFHDALAKDPGLAARAYRELAIAHQRLLSGAAGQRLQSAQRRVVDYLLSLTPTGRGEALVRLPYEKHLLASLLGMTPENFSRTLGRLAEQGVSVLGPDVRIDQIERLRAAPDGV
jgi:CRP/FNR family transcriptional activator FtrB